jgi:hypothetical protein
MCGLFGDFLVLLETIPRLSLCLNGLVGGYCIQSSFSLHSPFC